MLPLPRTEMALVVAAAVAVLTALYASPRAVLATIAILVLAASIAWIASYSEDPLRALVAANDAACDPAADATCPANRCAIQNMDNPFFNPGPAHFGTGDIFSDNCSLEKSDGLMRARDRSGGVRFADNRAFYHVPSHDTADMRQWLYAMPDNCKHNQSACRPSPTILDKVRRETTVADGGSFVDYI